MSEAPKPKRTRAKATPAALVIDSQAVPSIEPEAQRGQLAGHQAASHEAQADSHAPPAPDAKHGQSTPATKATSPAGRIDAGNVPDPTSKPSAADLTAARACVRDRLKTHPEWARIIATVREMRLDSKLADMGTEAREQFIWGELDRLYPPPVCTQVPPPVEGKSATVALLEAKAEPAPLRDGSVKGLGDIPAGWPPLPANAALSVEIGWVQSNRLYVVEELASGGTRVHLERAHEPAPSRSAIGWLETSIRSYAKFVEVAAKASGPGDEDGENVNRERMAIDEIRGLLAEMAGNPTGPGG